MSQAKSNHPHRLMITLKTWKQKTALYLYCVVELLSLYTVNMMKENMQNHTYLLAQINTLFWPLLSLLLFLLFIVYRS